MSDDDDGAPSNNKRQRLAIHGDATTTTPNARPGVQRDEEPWNVLPREVVHRVVALCDTAARLALCRTCKASRDAVEHHEKLVYEAIISGHGVDEDFEDRVCFGRLLKTTITNRRMPVYEIPYRYRKIAALKTYLYKIDLPEDALDNFILRLEPSPQGESLLTIIDQKGISVNKLSSREHSRRIDGMDESTQWLDEHNFLAHTAVYYDSNVVYLLSEDPETGTWKSKDLNLHLNNDRLFIHAGTDWVYDGQEIHAVMFSNELQTLMHASVNLVDESVTTDILAHQDYYSRGMHALEMVGLARNRWLLFTCILYGDGPKNQVDFAYNLDTKQSAEFLSATEDSMDDLDYLQQATDCSTTFCAVRKSSETIVVFELGDDGLFSEKISFAHPAVCKRDYTCRKIVGAFRSYVFIYINYTWLQMYDTKLGNCCRSVLLAGFLNFSVSSIRNEFFVAAERVLAAEDAEEDGVRVFCLEEPLVV